MASGGPGGGNESPGRGTDAAKRQHGRRPPDTDTPWGLHSTIRVSASCYSRPAQSSGYAAPPLRSASLSAGLSPAVDRQSCELTRLVPCGWSRGVCPVLASVDSRPRGRDAGQVAAAAAGIASARQTVPSRSIAQQRTSSLRARATIACFLRVLPPWVSRP